MTSAESTILGIVIGAVLTWLVNAANSRAQWQREERRSDADRQRAQKTDLYQDMLKRTRHLVRVQSLLSITGPPPKPTPRDVADLDDWSVRVALFASPEVSARWDEWLEIHLQGGEIRRTGMKLKAQRVLYADQTRRREAAHRALVEQMKRELGVERHGAARPMSARLMARARRRQSLDR